MDPNSQNALNEILKRMDALDAQLKHLTSRMDEMEGEKKHPDAVLEADSEVAALSLISEPKPSAFELPPAPAEVLPPPQPPPQPPALPAAPSVAAPVRAFEDEETVIETPAAAAAIAGVPTIQMSDTSQQKEFQMAAAGLRPGTVPSRKPKESWEMRIATYWLPRIGLLFLALVCGLFAREHAQGPLGKVIVAYLASLGLMAAGLWYEKKYPVWARPVLAGGLAFSYFASYAMGFVEPMRLLDHLGAKLVILGLNLALIFGVAHWKKSEVIGGTALLLGYLTTGVVGNDVAAFSSSLALSAAALLFLWLNQWFVATAVAAAATYIAHFYVWKAVPEADTRTALEAFWHHFVFLSLYFTVFATAGLVGKKAALEESESSSSGGYNPLSRRNLLTVLTQTNVAAYLAGMIAVLKLTEVYWNQSWMFFFPLAAVCAVLGLMFIGISSVQVVYLLAGTVAFSLGVLALASPMWLPIFLAAQGLVMLWGARGRYNEIWVLLSLGVLGYAIGYLVSGGAIDILQFSNVSTVAFPWWTYAGVTFLVLVYSLRWELGVATRKSDPQAVVAYMIAMVAGWVWIYVASSSAIIDSLLIYGLAIPIVALTAVRFRAQGVSAFVVITAALTFFEWKALQRLGEWSVAPAVWWAGLGLAGLIAGLVVEKWRTGNDKVSRLLWCTLYLWAALLVSLKIHWDHDGLVDVITFVLLFAGLVGLGYLMRSAAVAKAAYVFVPFVPIALLQYRIEPMPVGVLLCAAGLVAVAYPVALPLWRFRTGDSQPVINRIGQAFVVFVAWSLFYRTVTKNFGWDGIFAHGVFALMCAAYAAAGRFAAVVWVFLLCAGTVGIMLLYRLSDGLNILRQTEGQLAGSAGWALAGVLLLVAGERVLARASAIRSYWSNPLEDWLKPGTMRLITGLMAALTLVMAVMALRTLPDLKLFYFTGAIVAAAFLWIVFGFLFNEPVYRKSGFVLLCLGIVKGLVWDVLSLKETFYRLVSWSILGLLALAASFLYTKFRGRIGSEGDGVEPSEGT